MHRRYVRMALASVVLASFLSAQAVAQDEQEKQAFYEKHRAYVGLYALDDGERLILGMYPDAPIFYVSRMTTGHVRFLDPAEEHTFTYGPTRSVATPAAGSLQFTVDEAGAIEGLRWTHSAESPRRARRVPVEIEEVRFDNDDQARLAGMLMTPPGPGPYPVAVLLPQADRFDLWEVGMWILAQGIGVLAYDQRNATMGESTGEAVRGYYHEQQPVYATDAATAVRFIRTHPRVDAQRVGVVGWSGGGWMGALVAAEIPNLAFYVNIAGNASPGLEQAQHRFVARLLREGYSDEEVAEADRFLSIHHDVARGKGAWEPYVAERERVAETPWYQFLNSRFSMYYDDLEDATTWGSAVEAAPSERDYERVTTPTLGLFFEFDHSSPPSTPLIFHRALRQAGNGNFAIYVFPGVNHGAWEVESLRFNTREITRRAPEVFTTLVDWIARQVALAEKR